MRTGRPLSASTQYKMIVHTTQDTGMLRPSHTPLTRMELSTTPTNTGEHSTRTTGFVQTLHTCTRASRPAKVHHPVRWGSGGHLQSLRFRHPWQVRALLSVQGQVNEREAGLAGKAKDGAIGLLGTFNWKTQSEIFLLLIICLLKQSCLISCTIYWKAHVTKTFLRLCEPFGVIS